MNLVFTGSHGVGKTTLARKIYKHIKEVEMKIATTGAHGTGKTTISKLLAGRKKMIYLPEAPLQAMMAGLPISEETTIETEIWILAKQIEMESMHKDNFVADKCLIDLYAYALYFFPKETGLLDLFERSMLSRIKNYDAIFYMPAGEFPIEDDGFRSTDPKFQLAIDNQILKILNHFKIEYVTLSGSVQERFDKACRKIIVLR